MEKKNNNYLPKIPYEDILKILRFTHYCKVTEYLTDDIHTIFCGLITYYVETHPDIKNRLMDKNDEVI